MKKMRQSKTMWFSLALVVLGALFDLFPNLQSILDPKYYSIGFVVIGLLVAILRFLTTQPIER
jgi:hypothetical protein